MGVLAATGWVMVGVATWSACSLLARVTWPTLTPLIQSSAPVMLLVGYPAVVVALVRHAWMLAILGGLIVAGHLLAMSTLLTRRRPRVPGGDMVRLRVVFANVLYDNGQVADVVRTVLGADPDVVALSELTPGWVDELARNGLTRSYDEELSVTTREPHGVGVFSRVPLNTTLVVPVDGGACVRVELEVGDRIVRVVALQMPTPFERGSRQWVAALHAVGSHLDAAAPPTVVVGDFNAVHWHPPFRRLTALGFRDAHVWLGRGLSRSWPARFPLIRIDHALLGPGMLPVSIRDLTIPGSDHRGFLVELAVSRPAPT